MVRVSSSHAQIDLLIILLSERGFQEAVAGCPFQEQPQGAEREGGTSRRAQSQGHSADCGRALPRFPLLPRPGGWGQGGSGLCPLNTASNWGRKTDSRVGGRPGKVEQAALLRLCQEQWGLYWGGEVVRLAGTVWHSESSLASWGTGHWCVGWDSLVASVPLGSSGGRELGHGVGQVGTAGRVGNGK